MGINRERVVWVALVAIGVVAGLSWQSREAVLPESKAEAELTDWDSVNREESPDGSAQFFGDSNIDEPEIQAALSDRQRREKILGAAIRGVGQTRPELAIELLESLDTQDRARYANGLLPIFVQSIGMDGASALFDEMAARAIENGDANSSYMKSLFGQLAQRTLANAYTQGGWESALARLEPHVDQPYLDSRYVGQLAAGYGRENPKQALAWLGGLYESNPDEAPNALGYSSIVDACCC